jgi:acetyl/propionyl-CoA carboxylase alpha subunit
MVTGFDLVQGQLAVAAGRPLGIRQDDVVVRGAAIEARVYTEDPATGFLPATGALDVYMPPRGPGIRVDDGSAAGDEVSSRFDPLLAKVIAGGPTREAAIERLRLALRDTIVLGVTTNLPYLIDILDHEVFRRGETYTRFLDEHFAGWRNQPPSESGWLAAVLREVTGRGGDGRRHNGHATVTAGPWAAADSFRNAPPPE